MKILYLSFDRGISYWGTKGSSIHIREFTRALESDGHDVEVHVARHSSSDEARRNIHDIPSVESEFFLPRENADPKALTEAASFARNYAEWEPSASSYDLVYERYSLFSIAGLDLARKLRVPYVLEVNAPLIEEEKQHRGLRLESLARCVEGYLFQNADLVVCVSDVIRDYVLSVEPSARAEVLFNGVRAEPFVDAAPADWLTKQRGGGLVVGFVGSLKPWHGLEVLIRAFGEFAVNDGFHLVIVGDGPLRPQLEDDISRGGIADLVTFTGAMPYEDVPSALKGFDVAVAPYPSGKGFYFSPIKIFEYMASGRAIVASRTGQICDLLRDGENALTVPPGDSKSLVSALRRLKDDPSLRERLGQAAQTEAVERHTWSARAQTLTAMVSGLNAAARPSKLPMTDRLMPR